MDKNTPKLPPDLTPDKPNRKDFPTLKAYREALRQWEARDLVWVERQLLHDDPLRQLVTEFGSKSREADAKFKSGDEVGPRQTVKILVAQFKKACELGLKTAHDLGSTEEFDKAITAIADMYLKWFVDQCRSAVSDEAERELAPELERRLLKLLRQTRKRAWGSLRRRPKANISPGAIPGSADSLSPTPDLQRKASGAAVERKPRGHPPGSPLDDATRQQLKGVLTTMSPDKFGKRCTPQVAGRTIRRAADGYPLDSDTKGIVTLTLAACPPSSGTANRPD